MRTRCRRFAAFWLCIIMIVGNAVSGFASVPAVSAAQEDHNLISTENTVWRYLDDNTDPALVQDEGTAASLDEDDALIEDEDAAPDVELGTPSSAMASFSKRNRASGSNAEKSYSEKSTSYDRFSWTKPSFEDSAWKEAAGSFGAKKGAIGDLGNGYIPKTLLTHYIGDTKTAVPAYFFRTEFTVDDITAIEALEADIAYDDAVIIYINGEKVYEGQVPEGGYSSNLSYGSASGLSAPSRDTVMINDVSMLTEGTNILAVELHQDRGSSSDIYFDFCSLKPAEQETAATFKSVSLGVGADETQLNVVWYSSSNKNAKIQVAKKADMAKDAFPEKAAEFAAECTAANDSGYTSCQAVVTGLESGTEYVYRVGAGDAWSEIYDYTTRNYEDGFNFLLAGDPQIGTGGVASDTAGWKNTVATAMETFPDTSFLISAGDQVNTASKEEEYAGYLSPAELTSLPMSVNIGNHDAGSNAYSQHFMVPNISQMGKTQATGKYGGDYWYTYGGVLFMSLNSNNISTASHKEFMEKVVSEHGQDATWKVVTFHHSVYSTASHESDKDILQRRNELPPVFSDLGIDVVLMGHDHVYTRTFMMDGTKPVAPEDGSIPSSVTDPAEGEVLYITANSASGSKYYAIHNEKDFPYAAVKNQENTPNITNVNVTDTSFEITTYRVKDMSEVDTFTINKTKEPVVPPVPDFPEDNVSDIVGKLESALNGASTEKEKQDIVKAAVEKAVKLEYTQTDEAAREGIKALEDILVNTYPGITTGVKVESDQVASVSAEGSALSIPLSDGVEAKAVLAVKHAELPAALPLESSQSVVLDITLNIESADAGTAGEHIQPKVPVTITMKPASGLNLEKSVLLHYTGTGYETVKFTVVEGAVRFTANSFSTFVLAEKKDEPSDDGEDSDDDSNNNNSGNHSSSSSSASGIRQGTWKQNQTGWWYEYSDGTYPSASWLQIKNIWYYFGQTGYMQTGWVQVNGKWYYMNQDGSMNTNPLTYKGVVYYFNQSGDCVNP